MALSDFLSRTPKETVEERKDVNKISANTQDVMNIHNQMNHRKDIKYEVAKKGIEISNNTLKSILDKCEICKKKDKNYIKTSQYVEVEKPGDKIGIDIMEIGPKDKVFMAIDYFTRKLFAKAITTKDSKKSVAFLANIKNSFPFKVLLSDNGREFNNNRVEKWCKDNGVTHAFSIPYYHQSNGRVERVNRTLREACKKITGSTKSNWLKL